MRSLLRLACALPLLCSLATVGPARAEDVSGRFGLGLEAAAMKLTGGEHDYSDVNPNYALHLRYGLSPTLSVEGAFKTLWSRPAVSAPDEDAGFSWKATREIYTTIWELRAGLLYHFLPEKAASPFLGLDLGVAGFRVKDMRNQDGFGGLFPGGSILEGYDEDGKLKQLSSTQFTSVFTGGLEWFLAPRFSLWLGGRYHLFPASKLDNVGFSSPGVFQGVDYSGDNGRNYVDANNGMLEGFFGFTWFFGSTDKDGDGIPDKLDRCPGQAEDFDGFQDEDGCPDPDNDGDGIADALDRCPDVAEDLDGYQDDDGCPDPDNDGDGIADINDGCPNDAEDVDGFQDDDGCPDPDNDGDGVPDLSDACPNTPAGVEVDERGCPVVKEITEALVLKGVRFVKGSDQLTLDSQSILDDVAKSLLAYPDVVIEIQGHTDSSGSAVFNERLSLRRAESVRDYLVTQGVDIQRMRAVGYGERFPIASNGSDEGRAQNRRVEIHRIYSN